MPKLPKMPKMPKIKDFNHFMGWSSSITWRYELSSSSAFGP
jgi:hypothetical protein